MASWAHDLILVGGTLVAAFGTQWLSNKRTKRSDDQRSADEAAKRSHEEKQHLFDARREVYARFIAVGFELLSKVIQPTSQIDKILDMQRRLAGFQLSEIARQYLELGQRLRAAALEVELVTDDGEVANCAVAFRYFAELSPTDDQEVCNHRRAMFDDLQTRFMKAARRELGRTL